MRRSTPTSAARSSASRICASCAAAASMSTTSRAPGMLHAAILRSPSPMAASARSTRRRRWRMPACTPSSPPPTSAAVPTIPLRQQPLRIRPFEQPVIATDKVRYVGEPIAVVVADSAALAEDAVAAIALDIEPLPAVADRAAPPSAATCCCSRPTGTNLAGTLTAVKGDADAAFRAAAYVRREQFQRAAPHRGADGAARLPGRMGAAAGRLTVSRRRQGAVPQPPHPGEAAGRRRRRDRHDRERCRRRLRRARRVLSGGFPDPLCGAPCRPPGQMDRGPPRASACHQPCPRHRLRARDRLRPRRHDPRRCAATPMPISAPMSAPTARPRARNAAQILSGPYRVAEHPHRRLAALLTNKTPAGTYRGPGRFEADFFCERLFDMAAQRSRHRPGRVPPPQPDRRSRDALSRSPSRARARSRDRDRQRRLSHDRSSAASRRSAGPRRRALQGKLIDGRYHGLAIGCYFEGGASGPKENARLVLEPTASVSVYVGSSAIGQGLETVFAQIAADALKLPIDRIAACSTARPTYLPEGFGALQLALDRDGRLGDHRAARARCSTRSASRRRARLGCAAGRYRAGRRRGARAGDGRSVSLAELAPTVLRADGSFREHQQPPTATAPRAAHVAVDPGPARSRCSTMSRSRMSAASSTR